MEMICRYALDWFVNYYRPTNYIYSLGPQLHGPTAVAACPPVEPALCGVDGVVELDSPPIAKFRSIAVKTSVPVFQSNK
jgi:hypothetical protein